MMSKIDIAKGNSVYKYLEMWRYVNHRRYRERVQSGTIWREKSGEGGVKNRYILL